MEALTVKALYSTIDKIIKDNQDEIIKNMFVNTDDSMTTEEITGIITFNCLTLATKLSLQVVFELLQSQGILEIDDREIARLYLKHLSFGKDGSVWYKQSLFAVYNAHNIRKRRNIMECNSKPIDCPNLTK